jgi:deoxyribodipyrimidine photo-lyase
MDERAIFAFTRDLRLDDHLGLAEAARRGTIVPVLVIDAALAGRLRRSPRRAAYYCGAVASLAADLAAAGSRLIVRRGAEGATLRGLARGFGTRDVLWSSAYDANGIRTDRDVQSILEEAGIRALAVHDAPAIAPDDARLARADDGDGYRAFVPYFARWKTLAPIDAPPRPAFAVHDVQSEGLPEPAEFGATAVCPEPPSAVSVRAALEAYLDGPVLSYAVTRMSPASGPTSHLSAALSFGLVAARTIVRGIGERLADPFLLAEEALSLRLFVRSLATRDFFLQLAWHHPDLGDTPLQEKMRGFAFARSHADIDAWRHGRTGYALVDAGMRELRATGWMHPHVRSVAASFLCFDLGVDWRVGRDAWDTLLVEDDPALAVGNWQWAAGVGADLAAYPRIFNPVKQARRVDAGAQYVRRWLPEAANLSDAMLLDPLATRAEAQLAFALFGASAYPAPIVDHDVAARAFLARYVREVVPT